MSEAVTGVRDKAPAIVVAAVFVTALGGAVWLTGRLATTTDVVAEGGAGAAMADAGQIDGERAEDDHAGHDHGDHHHVTALDGDARFTGPGEVWPPQPKGATDVVTRRDVELQPVDQQVKLARLEAAGPVSHAPSQVVADDEATMAALGDDHELIAVEVEGRTTRLAWYSLSNNQTVEVSVDGDAVSSMATYLPSLYQPELSNSEKDTAVSVARAFWQGEGDTRIDLLTGFSILAFQPDGSYYDTRMVYVSFHVDADARPELLTLVDLVAGKVVKAEVDR